MLQEEKHAPKNVTKVDQLQTGVDDHPNTLSTVESYIKNHIAMHHIHTYIHIHKNYNYEACS